MNVSTQVAELLDVLAARFGTTAEHLWTVMVQYYTLKGWLGAAVGGGFILGGLVAGGFGRRAHQAVQRKLLAPNTGYDWDQNLRAAKEFRQVLLVAAGALVTIGILLVMFVGMERILVPEYFALQEILTILK